MYLLVHINQIPWTLKEAFVGVHLGLVQTPLTTFSSSAVKRPTGQSPGLHSSPKQTANEVKVTAFATHGMKLSSKTRCRWQQYLPHLCYVLGSHCPLEDGCMTCYPGVRAGYKIASIVPPPELRKILFISLQYLSASFLNSPAITFHPVILFSSVSVSICSC